MPWCPKCKSEFRDGFAVCSDCGVPLVSQAPETASIPPVVLEHPCLLATGNDVPDLDALLKLLRQSNIPAYLKDDMIKYNLPVNYLGIGRIYGICVDASRLSEAQRLLADSVADWKPFSPDSDKDESDFVSEETCNTGEDPSADGSDEDFFEEKDYIERYVRREKNLTRWIWGLTIGIPAASIAFLLFYLSK